MKANAQSFRDAARQEASEAVSVCNSMPPPVRHVSFKRATRACARRLVPVRAIRTAGEVADTIAIGSIEYAVEHLGTALIVVLGRENCGAVSAAVSQANEPGHIADILKAIQPAGDETRNKPGDQVDNAVRALALDVVKQLQGTGPIIAESVQSGKVRIVAARYDLHTGKVELLKQ